MFRCLFHNCVVRLFAFFPKLFSDIRFRMKNARLLLVVFNILDC